MTVRWLIRWLEKKFCKSGPWKRWLEIFSFPVPSTNYVEAFKKKKKALEYFFFCLAAPCDILVP